MSKKLLLILTLNLAASSSAIAQSKPITRISVGEARTIAMRKENGMIKSSDLEKEHGRWIYSFDISTLSGIREVNVDAYTGKVVEDSKETPADEERETTQDQKHKNKATQSQSPQ